jgi:hypothetical protein
MALGSTSLKKSDNIDALLGKSQSLPQQLPKSTGTTIKAAKLTNDEVEKIDLVKKMLGTDNTSEALRWCIKAAWAAHGDKIKEIVDKNESVSPIKI